MSDTRVARLKKKLHQTTNLLFATVLTGAVLMPTSIASAETGGYPNWDAVDCSAQHGQYSWCVNGVPGSSRGYDYRNCTDYVAWKVSTLGVSPAQYSGLGNAKMWNDNAAAHDLTTDSTPAVGSVAVRETGGGGFGHVAYVEAVNGDGTITVSDYNIGGDGNYATATDTPSNLGFTSYVHFEDYMPPTVSNVTPTITTPSSTIEGMTTAGTDVWAAGWERPTSGSGNRVPATYRYGDGSWTAHMPAPVGTGHNYLYDIASNGSSEVWAVGNYVSSRPQTLAYRWNGTTWTRVTSDNPGGTGTNSTNYLHKVAVDGGGTPWAIGKYTTTPGTGTHWLLEKWNGTKFAQQTLTMPSGVTAHNIMDITFSGSDGWIVGSAIVTGALQSSLIYHYDGTGWTGNYVTLPLSSGLTAVTALSPTDVWAVGHKWVNINSTQPLVLHYDGTGWTDVTGSIPFPANPQYTGLNKIVADGNNIWIVGDYVPSATNLVNNPLIMRFNGYAWTQHTDSSIPAGKTGTLNDAVVSAGDLWAGGYASFSPSTYPMSYVLRADTP